MWCKNDAPWMRGCRSRTNDWTLREKRSDTLIWTIEKQYDVNLWVRSDMELWTYKKQKWYNSLNDIIEDKN